MAVRPIDADEFERELLCDMALHGEQLSGDAAYNRALVILTQMPTLTPQNEPLTIEQLRQMDGEPVYIVFSPDVDGEKLQFWALVAVDEWDDVYLANKDEWAFNYEEFLEDVEAIYRRPPERQEDT